MLQPRPLGLRQLGELADEGSVATIFRPLPLRTVMLRAALALMVLLVAGLLLADAPAGAMVTTVGSTKVGLQPRSTMLFDGNLRFDQEVELEAMRPEPENFANESGNTIVGSSKTYVIYWDPMKDYYHGDWQHVIDTFMQSMGAASGTLGNVFAVDSQYTDAANEHALYKSTFHGAYTDTNGYPSSGCTDPEPPEPKDLIGPEVKGKHTPVCLTDNQLQEELTNFISQHSLPKGMGSIFYLLTPPSVTVCLDSGALASHCSDYKHATYVGTETKKEKEEKEAEEKAAYEKSFCSYHSDMDASNSSGGENTILYGVIPWTAGGLGDGDLGGHDNESAFDCQDGGYDPSSKPIEKHETKKIKGPKEIKEDEEKSPEEQAKIAEAELLEGPHQEEPNQVKCASSDGWCDTGLADLIINQIAVEQQNIVTNPLLNGWQDPHGYEATDECRDFFAPVLGGNVGAQEGSFAGTLYNQALEGNDYYLNSAFNLAALKLPYPGVSCLTGVSLVPQFTAPNPVNVNELVGFDGMESDISLNAGVSFNPQGVAQPNYATYTWNFGDGSAPVSGYAPGASTANSPNVSNCGSPTEWKPPCAASVYHSYQYGGTYEVSLTVTDVGGNTATINEPVTVVGPLTPPPPPPPPPPAPSPAPATVPTGGSGTPGGSGGTTPTPTVFPPPVLGAGVTSKSLKKALSSGLPVHYSANEQVAGSIQVLIESSTAKRLGIKGATATGLPAGTPRSVVVGTAVLVTTKAGQGTIRIKFSSQAASRLKHTRKLKVTLRLIARNASRQSPQTATFFSTVVLNP
jgi:hypothetical protein